MSRSLALLVFALAAPVDALASPDDGPRLTEEAPARPDHANPRFELSYRSFAIANLDGTPVPLEGAQLDLYALSRRWARAGLELEGGAGKAAVDGVAANLGYGMLGVSAGLQYPARVTPFVAGRFAGGVLGGQLDGAVTIPTGGTSAATVQSGTAATYMYGGGIDVGVDVYTVGRAYVSASLGWVRTTWHGVDMAAMMADPQGGMRYKDITGDSFTFKLGLGL